MKKQRRKFTNDFKSKVVLETLRERQTISELAQKYEVHPNQITTWKKEFLNKAPLVFDQQDIHTGQGIEIDKLYAKIGQLEMENDFLKKASLTLNR